MGIEPAGSATRIEEVIAGLKAKEKWSDEDGRVLVEAFETSGLQPTAFCRRYGLKPCRLWWRLGKGRRERKGAEVTAGRVAFAPVRLVENGLGADKRPWALGAAGESMEVVLGNGRRLVVGPKFEASALARLVNALEGISC